MLGISADAAPGHVTAVEMIQADAGCGSTPLAETGITHRADPGQHACGGCQVDVGVPLVGEVARPHPVDGPGVESIMDVHRSTAATSAKPRPESIPNLAIFQRTVVYLPS